jgi:hypothetical protein
MKREGERNEAFISPKTMFVSRRFTFRFTGDHTLEGGGGCAQKMNAAAEFPSLPTKHASIKTKSLFAVFSIVAVLWGESAQAAPFHSFTFDQWIALTDYPNGVAPLAAFIGGNSFFYAGAFNSPPMAGPSPLGSFSYVDGVLSWNITGAQRSR